jgi:hypothetical protein
LKQLYEKHTNKNIIIKNDNSPTIGELVRNDAIYVRYYAHRMNNFRNFLKNKSIMFGEVQDYFFVTNFQSGSPAHDHGLLWVKSPTIQHFFRRAS